MNGTTEEYRQRLLERMKQEAVYEDLSAALRSAAKSVQTAGEDLIVYQREDGRYLTVHPENWELALQLGYQLIADFQEILNLAEKM